MTSQITISYNENTSTLRGLYDSDHIYRIIDKSRKFYEIKLLEKIKSMNLNGVYVDVGSNIGNHTLFFSKHCNPDKVISLEINNEIFKILEINVKENNLENVHMLNIGIGEDDKVVSISDIDENNVGTTHVINSDGNTKITTLDSILLNEENISLIKIDVEGYEKNVILGAKKILKKYSPVLVVELETEEKFDEFEKIVRRFGYKTDKKNYAHTPTYIWTKETKKYDFIYMIPSYNRFEKAKRLVDQIISFGDNSLIILINDGSDSSNYNLFENYYDNLVYLKNEFNNGKQNYWKTVNKLFFELSNYEYDYCLMLNDDFIFIDNFLEIINKLKNEDDIIRLFTPTTITGKNWEYENWIDGAFFCYNNFMEKLNYEIFPINKSTTISSGVGKQMTIRLNNLNFKVKNYGSLVYHDGNEDSVMHPEYRKIDPLIGIMYQQDPIEKDLSIIIPTFNNIEYIDECLNSIIKSIDNRNVEILIGIDGCEKTYDFLKKYDLNNHVSIFYSEKNVGPYVIKNSLSLISNSENILFFDSDDVVFPNMIPEILDKLNSYDIIKPMFHNFTGELKQDDIIYQTKTKDWGEGVFAIKKDIFLKFNGFEPWKCAADTEFSLRMYKNNIKSYHTEYPLFFRRIHDKGLTSSPETNFKSELRKQYIKIIIEKEDFSPLYKMETCSFKQQDNFYKNQVSQEKKYFNEKLFDRTDINLRRKKLEKHSNRFVQIEKKPRKKDF